MDKRPEVMSTAEPFFVKGNSIGCLLVHGYTGTPKEMRLLADSLAMEGYTLLAPRLFGHATDPEDMLRARWWDWVANVEDALTVLKGCTEHQVVMGLSMGGALSLLTAARHPVDAVVSLSTPYDMPHDPRVKFLKYIYWMMPRQPKGKPDWQNAEAQADHVDYPYFPTRSLLELKSLLETMQSELPNVNVPAFFTQSHADQTIPPESLDYLFDHVGSPQKSKLWVENSGHVIIREPEREVIFAAVKDFIRQAVPQQ